MCALPKSKVCGGSNPETRILKVVQCCPESPIMGGKHRKPSTFCVTHENFIDSASALHSVIALPDHLAYHRLEEHVPLPDSDDTTLFVGCKKSQNVNHYYDRTAGVFALVRPCGIIVNFTEMFTCESATQAYVFIYTTFGRSLQDLRNLKYLGYDRACDLHPFLKNLKRKGSVGAGILLDSVKFMVDLFHCNKHTESTCMPPENPKCKYHPKLNQFSAVHGVNTECAEQAFKWLGKFKHITRKMTRNRFCFFLWCMIEYHNKRLERKQASRH